jgi:hypothetical protein
MKCIQFILENEFTFSFNLYRNLNKIKTRRFSGKPSEKVKIVGLDNQSLKAFLKAKILFATL